MPNWIYCTSSWTTSSLALSNKPDSDALFPLIIHVMFKRGLSILLMSQPGHDTWACHEESLFLAHYLTIFSQRDRLPLLWSCTDSCVDAWHFSKLDQNLYPSNVQLSTFSAWGNNFLPVTKSWTFNISCWETLLFQKDFKITFWSC